MTTIRTGNARRRRMAERAARAARKAVLDAEMMRTLDEITRAMASIDQRRRAAAMPDPARHVPVLALGSFDDVAATIAIAASHAPTIVTAEKPWFFPHHVEPKPIPASAMDLAALIRESTDIVTGVRGILPKTGPSKP